MVVIRAELQTLRSEKIQELVKSPGPCITIFLPAFRPGEQTLNSQAMLLRHFLDNASERLETLHVDRQQARDLLQPLRDFAEDASIESGCHWSRAFLRSPGVFEEALLREPVPPNSTVRDRFDILPLLGALELPPDFYVLKISRKHAALFRASFAMEPLSLPGKIPDNVAEFLELDVPDHDRENRSSVTPGGRRVRFGTGTERETQQAYLADYYRALDQALHELPNAHKMPLILAGVDEDTALYRGVNSYPNLLEGTIRGGASEEAMIEEAYTILRATLNERSVRALADAKERLAPARFTTNLDAIAGWASEGRVGRVFIRAGAAGDEEKLNAAAVETIRHGGEAVMVPADKMPEGEIAAALRF